MCRSEPEREFPYPTENELGGGVCFLRLRLLRGVDALKLASDHTRAIHMARDPKGTIMTNAPWKSGRGAPGPMLPLLGVWRHSGPSKLGAVKCVRSFDRILGGKFIQLRAEWRTSGKTYEEVAVFGLNRQKQLAFWSFTSDGGAIRRNTQRGAGHPSALCLLRSRHACGPRAHVVLAS